MKEIINRLKAATPTFFKNIIKISFAITTLSSLLLTSGLVIPESVAGMISQIAIVASITSIFISTMTTKYGVKDGEVVQPFTVNPDTKPNPPKKED